MATNTGVFTIADEALTPVESRNDRARSGALCLLFDREGQLWMGTIESGLNVLLTGRGVRFLRADKEGFRSIEIDRNGVHWVSNERRVLTFRTDGERAPVSVAEARFEGFDALMIYGIAEDPGGALLFAMNGGSGHSVRRGEGLRYQSPGLWGGNFRMDGMYSIDLGIQKKILKNKGNIKLSLTDIFLSNQWQGDSQFGGLFMDIRGGYDSRRIRLNFNYIIGKETVKSARKRNTGLEDEQNRIKSEN